MCRKLALLATVLTLAAPMLAVAKPPPAPNATDAKAAAAAPHKATPEERAEAERMEPLGRAAFWAREVDADPRDADAGVKLAKALRDLGRYDEASAAADQVLVLNPANLDALLESARARIAANEGFYAIEPARRAEAVAPRDWRPPTLLAIALEQSKRDDEALAAHQKALALAPDNPAVLTNLGMYFATHGDPAQAEPLLRRAASLPSATSQERQNLALVLGLEGRVDEAEHLLRQDLPPMEVDNDLAYFRGASTTPAPGRTWDALRSAQ